MIAANRKQAHSKLAHSRCSLSASVALREKQGSPRQTIRAGFLSSRSQLRACGGLRANIAMQYYEGVRFPCYSRGRSYIISGSETWQVEASGNSEPRIRVETFRSSTAKSRRCK